MVSSMGLMPFASLSIYIFACSIFSSSVIRSSLSHYQLIRLLQELRRDRAVQLPGDIHRPAARVLHVVRRAQIGVRLRTANHMVWLKLTGGQ